MACLPVADAQRAREAGENDVREASPGGRSDAIEIVRPRESVLWKCEEPKGRHVRRLFVPIDPLATAKPALRAERSARERMKRGDGFHPILDPLFALKDGLEGFDSPPNFVERQFVYLTKRSGEKGSQPGHALVCLSRNFGPRGVLETHGEHLDVFDAQVVERYGAGHPNSVPDPSPFAVYFLHLRRRRRCYSSTFQ